MCAYIIIKAATRLALVPTQSVRGDADRDQGWGSSDTAGGGSSQGPTRPLPKRSRRPDAEEG